MRPLWEKVRPLKIQNVEHSLQIESQEKNEKKWSQVFNMDSYLVTPGGTLQRYNVDTGEIDVICIDMPRDPAMP